jgi:hypothetical protein
MVSMLYNVPLSSWVFRTALAMDADNTTSQASWRKHWADGYWALGGASNSTANKGCAASAAYALWYLGWLKGTNRASLDWPVQRIRDRLGKNAAYAAIAARLLAQYGFTGSHTRLWRLVRQDFQIETGERPAESDQGAVKLALGLFLDGNLESP